jgi:LysM repeat protein
VTSLSAHLVEPGDHGRLGFHAGCPVCRRERLLGSLSSEPVVSRRAQAALATGVLAVSVAAPGAVSAREPDSGGHGIVAPEEPSDERLAGGPGEEDSAVFEPGGETALPIDVAPPPAAPPSSLGGETDDGGEELGALEHEPRVDSDGRLEPLSGSEGEEPPTGTEAPVPPGTEAQPPAPPAFGHPPPAATTPAVPEIANPDPQTEQTRERSGHTRRDGDAGSPRRQAAEPAPVSQPTAPELAWQPPTTQTEQPAPAREPALAPSSSAPPIETSARSGESAPAADVAVHVVRPGESLWSIAKRLLAPDATAARIAREVSRLWELNGDRIATGDPDLLIVGTRLRLR